MTHTTIIDKIIAREKANTASGLEVKAGMALVRLTKALEFIADITEEELQHAKVGTGAEVALRHSSRRAREALNG